MNITQQRSPHPVLAGLPATGQSATVLGSARPVLAFPLWALPVRSAAEKCCNGGLCSCVASCDCVCAGCVC